MKRSIQIQNQFDPLPYPPEHILELLHSLDHWPEYRIPPGELSIVLLDEQRLAQIHQEFMQDPSPTDVITFPGDSDMDSAGEICISAQRAQTLCQQYQHSYAQELTLYLVHGWLHLAGLDDTCEQSRALMRQGEQAALHYLKQQGL